MDVYEATTLVKSLTKQRTTFRLEFYGFDETKQRSTGLKRINQCVIRPGNPKDKNDDYKLQLHDVERDENRSCWIPLIKSVNGINVVTP